MHRILYQNRTENEQREEGWCCRIGVGGEKLGNDIRQPRLSGEKKFSLNNKCFASENI